MRPFLILLGLLLGSAVSITFSLLAVTIVFALLGPRYPRLGTELEPLLASLGLFVLLTVAAALSFYGELKARPWRRPSQGVAAVLLVWIGGYYWP